MFIDSTHGLMVGERGAVLAYDRTVVGAQEDRSTVPATSTLLQNYPNPFNPRTSIKFTLHTSVFASLKVYDVLGRQVGTLVNEALPSGEYSRTWDASNMPSGVYYYRLQAGSLLLVRKMLVVK
jgi:hypothetical protein